MRSSEQDPIEIFIDTNTDLENYSYYGGFVVISAQQSKNTVLF